jgi:hypothetical protein
MDGGETKRGPEGSGLKPDPPAEAFGAMPILLDGPGSIFPGSGRQMAREMFGKIRQEGYPAARRGYPASPIASKSGLKARNLGRSQSGAPNRL